MPDLEFASLRSFVVLAGTRSFPVAARELAISPSGLAKRIQALERQAGGRLVVRDQGGVAGLTPAGARLLRAAPQLLAAIDQLHASVRDVPPATLRVAIQGSDRCLRSAFLALRAIRPGVRVRRLPLDRHEGADLLRRGQADLIVTDAFLAAGDLQSIRLSPSCYLARHRDHRGDPADTLLRLLGTDEANPA
jgi:DNA-binding transcriptional LysR family regulator